jgi:predicted alpha/beta-fold hydrolase
VELARPIPCRPPFWAKGGHAQTILGHVLPSRGKRLAGGAKDVEPHTIKVSDTDSLRAHYVPSPAKETIVLLFHGLGGSSSSDYMERIAAVCLARGYSVLAVNHRGCGEGTGLASGAYHSGRSDDLARALEYADDRLRHPRRIVIGFSLSGNALLLQLAQGSGPLPDAGIAVNPPIDLALASERISTGLNRIYDLRFVHQCRRAIRERVEAGLLEHAVHIPALATLHTVDELFTAPQSGFADAADYYERCSTHKHLGRITVPTIILSSHDDPFVPPGSLLGAEVSDQVHVHVERHGGHIGYLTKERTPLGTCRWLDYAMGHYLRELEGIRIRIRIG